VKLPKCPPIQHLPDAEFWRRVRESRYSVHIPMNNAMYETWDVPVKKAAGKHYTAQPVGIYCGGGVYVRRIR
jgi:hypothetical protein